jgi:uncharacterized protein YqjF (DUF2071 family)
MKNAIANRRTLSDLARRRMLAFPGEPMFYARWEHAVFIHYTANPTLLQPDIPFQLDLRDGRAFVSVVAFTLSRMRPRVGGRLGELLFKPIATHEFLNIRTYVRHQGEAGIYFLAEWLSNPLSVLLGPRSFGLPYHFGQIVYRHCEGDNRVRGSIKARDDRLVYEGHISNDHLEECEAGSLTEFLLERYTAFTHRNKRSRFFRVWHSPWPQARAQIELSDDSLLDASGPWWKTAQYLAANYSPGVAVWMGRPHRID